MEEQFEAEVVQGRTAWNGAELVWDRKIEGGFPELKELVSRIASSGSLNNRLTPNPVSLLPLSLSLFRSSEYGI